MAGTHTYAKIVNASALTHEAPRAHRNRIRILAEILEREARQCQAESRPLRAANVGCGPAVELQRFLEDSELCGHLDAELIDFNRETLDFARGQLLPRIRPEAGKARLAFTHQSVNDLIREATGQSEGTRHDLDLVYCAGLFDYLGRPTCEALLELYLSWVRPGGLVVATNVTPNHSSTGFMTLLLEWNLRLRNAEEMLQLAPHGGQSDVFSDDTGVNVFLTIRKDG